MAVVFDAATLGTGVNVASITFAHTVGAAGANRLLVVGVGLGENQLTTVSSITYAGIALTSIGRITNGTLSVDLWRLVAPATGANNVVITVSLTDTIIGSAVSFTGVDQTTPAGAFTSATGNSTVPSVTVTSAVNDMVMDAGVASGSPTWTVTAPQTQRTNTGIFNAITGVSGTNAGAASVTLAWTLNAAQPWALGAITVNQAAAGAGVVTPRLLGLLGVGA